MGQSVDGSALVSGDGNRIDQSSTVNIYYGLPPDKPAPNRTDRNEKTLINSVWTEVEDRLRQSLHNAILVRLDMAEPRSQVSRPWDSELRTADQKAKTLAPGTPIAEVFDRRDVGGKLLVLGNPGAGKTTTMLDLAASLVQRANADPDEPIPVIFNLSSWRDSQQSLTEWMWEFLKERDVLIQKKLWKAWLKEKKILPLLDGLDELPPSRQEPVVKAINTWLKSEEGSRQLLVCSRREEYELYAAKLDLNGAICLSPLTNSQLQSYLTSLDMGHLWETLHHDADLLELIRTPLLLSVSILANDAIKPMQWEKLETTRERLDYLLDAYLLRRLTEVSNTKDYKVGKEPSKEQIKLWLAIIAVHLTESSKDEFLIEKLEPGMLENPPSLFLYAGLVSISTGIFAGICIGLILGLTLNLGYITGIYLSNGVVPTGKPFFFIGLRSGTINAIASTLLISSRILEKADSAESLKEGFFRISYFERFEWNSHLISTKYIVVQRLISLFVTIFGFLAGLAAQGMSSGGSYLTARIVFSAILFSFLLSPLS